MARCLRAAHLHAVPGAEGALERYFQLLMEWNRRMNLTGFREPEAAVEKHLGDTLLLLPHLPTTPFRMLDIGTGPGVPGLLVAILLPWAEVWACDAVRKKVSFCRFAAASLGLGRVRPLHLRLSPSRPSPELPLHGFEVVVSQAMASAASLARLALPYLSPEGRIIAMKGRYARGDREADGVVFRELGLEANIIRGSHPLTGAERCLVVMRQR